MSFNARQIKAQREGKKVQIWNNSRNSFDDADVFACYSPQEEKGKGENVRGDLRGKWTRGCVIESGLFEPLL